MKMGNNQKLFLLTVLLAAGSAFAGYAPNCGYPKNDWEVEWCEEHHWNNHPPFDSDSEIDEPKGAFCTREGNHVFGWGFADQVHKIDSLSGMPHPMTEYKLIPRSSGVFSILQLWKPTGLALKSYGPFKWITPLVFKDESHFYMNGQCATN